MERSENGMAAPGRKRPVILAIFEPTERPLLVKADIPRCNVF